MRYFYYYNTAGFVKSTYYALDAQGNTLSVYEYNVDNENSTVTYSQEEKYIYGSLRLGVLNETVYLLGSVTLANMSDYKHIIGQRTYELSNHLGNVLSVVSDKITQLVESTVVYSNDFSAGLGVSFNSDPFVGLSVSGGRLEVTNVQSYYSTRMVLSSFTTADHNYKARFTIDLNGSGHVIVFVLDSKENSYK